MSGQKFQATEPYHFANGAIGTYFYVQDLFLTEQEARAALTKQMEQS